MLPIEKCVRYSEVSAVRRTNSIENLQFFPKNGVHYRGVSAIKHVRHIEVSLHRKLNSTILLRRI